MTEHFPLMVPGAKSAGADISVTAPFDDSAIADVAVADMKTVETALELRLRSLQIATAGFRLVAESKSSSVQSN